MRIRCPTIADQDRTKDFLAKDETESKFLETIPLGRLCQPLDVANAVCFLASDDASFITGVALDVCTGVGDLM